MVNSVSIEKKSFSVRLYEAVATAVRSLMGTCGVGEPVSRAVLEQTFNTIVCRHGEMIRKICFGYARSREELDDLCQDSLINIWQSLPRFRGDSAMKTWVYRVTLNTCVSTLRKRRDDAPKAGLDLLHDIIDESEERRLMIMELHECIARLSPVDKAIVLMWLDEFSYDEIAAMTGLQRNTVATRLRRAKEKMKLKM